MTSLIKILSKNVGAYPEKKAFISIEGKNQSSISYCELQFKIHEVGKQLIGKTNEKPVLLLFDETFDFIVAFLACQLTGNIAVPMFYPKSHRYFDRLNKIIDDSQCELVLCSEKNRQKLKKGLSKKENQMNILSFDINHLNSKELISEKYNEISFIQYTSGSTGDPKGVVVSQVNLSHNQELIQNTFGCDKDSVILSWLPFYHDMGLIGNILHALFTGSTCILMSGVDVLQNPLLWLRTIDKYNVTHSGGPNFIYDYCLKNVSKSELEKLDLSSWKVAYNGSEPIKTKTIIYFTEHFKDAKFNKEAFKTCYGLAEATLIVSGGNPEFDKEKASSGKICEEMSVIFYNPDSHSINNDSGEICLNSPSVTTGYWRKNDNDLFVEYNDRQYLRTGDVGELVNGQLFVTGRLKEIVIVNGKNYYPYDIENEISERVKELDGNGVVVSYVENEVEEIVVFAEIKRGFIGKSEDEIIRKIDQEIISILGTDAFDIILLTPRKIPRTSSGKLQRIKVKEQYLQNKIESLIQKRKRVEDNNVRLKDLVIQLKLNPENDQLLEAYLLELLSRKLSFEMNEDLIKESSLLDLGVSSLSGVDLVYQINQDLEIAMEISQLLELNQFYKIHNYLKNLLWLKSQPEEGEEIFI